MRLGWAGDGTREEARDVAGNEAGDGAGHGVEDRAGGDAGLGIGLGIRLGLVMVLKKLRLLKKKFGTNILFIEQMYNFSLDFTSLFIKRFSFISFQTNVQFFFSNKSPSFAALGHPLSA